MYADFESVLVNQSECAPEKQRNTKKKSWTKKIQRHVPCGANLYIKSSDDHFFRKPEIFRGEDSIEQFLDAVITITVTCYHYLLQMKYEIH